MEKEGCVVLEAPGTKGGPPMVEHHAKESAADFAPDAKASGDQCRRPRRYAEEKEWGSVQLLCGIKGKSGHGSTLRL